jgi:hypothetical protein
MVQEFIKENKLERLNNSGAPSWVIWTLQRILAGGHLDKSDLELATIMHDVGIALGVPQDDLAIMQINGRDLLVYQKRIVDCRDDDNLKRHPRSKPLVR